MSPDREPIDSSPRFSVLRAAVVLVVFAVGVAVLIAVGTRPSVSTPSPTTFPETSSTPTTTAASPTSPTTAPSTTTTAPSHTTTAPTTRSGTGRDSHHHTPSTTTPTVAAPGSVSVVVANGTHTAGLAAHYSGVLGNSGWSMKAPTNATTAATTSAVYYATSQQAAANEIATALGVKKSQVLPMTSSVPVPAVTGIDVVVVIGQDLAGASTGAGA